MTSLSYKEMCGFFLEQGIVLKLMLNCEPLKLPYGTTTSLEKMFHLARLKMDSFFGKRILDK